MLTQEFLDMVTSEPMQVRKATTENSSYEWKIPGQWDLREALVRRHERIMGTKFDQTPGEWVVSTHYRPLPAHVFQLVLEWVIWYLNHLYITMVRRHHRRDAISIPSDQIDRFLFESQFVNDD
jgi:hypothetical protein